MSERARRPLTIVCSIFDPMKGGPVMRARAVYQVMQRQGHSPRIVLPDMEGTAAAYVEEGGVPCDRLAIEKPVMPNRPAAFLRFLLALTPSIGRMRRYLIEKKPDVVHVNGAFDVVAAFAGRLAGIPVVWHLNDSILGPRVSAALGRVVRSLATEIVVAATRVGRHYGIPAERATLLPAPVDVHRFPARETGYLPGPQVRLGLVGNWNWVKAQDRFVETIDRLRSAGIDARGTIVGGFISRQERFWKPILADIERRGLTEAIDAPGFCDDVPGAMADFDLLLLTSRSEACPMCVLEAMSIGVPVVTFDVGGVREMLGEGDDAAGIVVPEGDIDAMERAVRALLSDCDRYRSMARNGQCRARALFSLEACVQRHENIYLRATGKHS
jgi:glycosyltransferase involved in cell wall biosynthesis